MVLKAYKFRLYPSEDQQQSLAQVFGSVRFVFNWGLSQKKTNWDIIESMRLWNLIIPTEAEIPTPLNHAELSRKLTHELKDGHPWLREVADKPLRYALRNLDEAYKNFFRRVKNGEAPGFPKFKSRKNGFDSFQVQGENVRLDDKTGLVSLPKIEKIPIRLHRRIDGTIKTTTVSKTKSGKYYISFQVEDGRELPLLIPIRSDKTVGIDVGLNSFVTTSSGEKIDGIKAFRESEKRLAVMQRRASRKVKGSENWKKAQKKVAILHERIANQRGDFQHKLSHRLVTEYDMVAVEDLNIKGMVKNHHLAKTVSDAAWSEFIRQLEYKAAWGGKTFVKIGRWEPTSKTCSSCGYKNGEMPLSVREWDCPECGAHHDRDINAAINIKAAGMNLLHTNSI
ncbi:MAG: RNA-guided endonuclease TnpB family protein [Methanothrix sp.]